MIKIEVNKSKTDIKLEGTETNICAELMMAYNKIVEVMADQREESFECAHLEMFQLLSATREATKDILKPLKDIIDNSDEE
jgi:hypothetical protein